VEVRVKPTGPLTTEWTVTLVDAGEDRWEVFAENGRAPLGVVSKGHYTYSPPAAGFGGRIVRFHKQVKCWENSVHSRAHFRTRNEALADLIRASQEEPDA
jgi:hypothetical protein